VCGRQRGRRALCVLQRVRAGVRGRREAGAPQVCRRQPAFAAARKRAARPGTANRGAGRGQAVGAGKATNVEWFQVVVGERQLYVVGCVPKNEGRVCVVPRSILITLERMNCPVSRFPARSAVSSRQRSQRWGGSQPGNLPSQVRRGSAHRGWCAGRQSARSAWRAQRRRSSAGEPRASPPGPGKRGAFLP